MPRDDDLLKPATASPGLAAGALAARAQRVDGFRGPRAPAAQPDWLPGIGVREALLMAATLALGLAADVRVDIVGQTVIGAMFWLVLFHVLRRLRRDERTAMFACLALATFGELVCSLGWGLYTYRLHNVPQFVPPGHALMLMCGVVLSRRMPERGAWLVFAAAGLYSITAAAVDRDTLGPLLFAVLAIHWLAFPTHRRLYASTLLLSLALELYGTWLGNWGWHRDVPWTGLVTTNPPFVAGAFYCLLDAAVVMVSMRVLPALSARRSLARIAAASRVAWIDR